MTDTILPFIEEQKGLELVVMLGWQARFECNLLLDARPPVCDPQPLRPGTPYGALWPLSSFT